MHRPAVEGVVEILAMGRRAIDQCRGLCRKRLRVPDGRARPAAVDAGDHCFHIIGVTRRHAQTDNIDQQCLGAGAHRLRQLVDGQCHGLIGEFFSYSHFG